MNDLEMNPYVVQMDKYAKSLEKLSKIFLVEESSNSFFEEQELEHLCERVCEKTCRECGNCELCMGRERTAVYNMICGIFQAVENCGAELNIEVKRKVQKRCVQAPRFLRNAVEIYRDGKKDLVWNRKIALNREGCAVQLDSFAQMIQHATRELDASIFSDEHLERKIRNRFARMGLKLLTTVFFVTESGRYEIHITLKVNKGSCIATKEIAQIISECCGRRMILGKGERTAVGLEYCTITCVEGPQYHVLSGVAKIGKGRRKVSGDSFSMLDLPGGKSGAILSDGMGAGVIANRESTKVVELLEELLEAGFPKETAVQMLNTALTLSREEVRFSTIDMAIFDLYSGMCEFLKAGAAMSFIKRADEVRCVKSTSLPVGVVSKLETDIEEHELCSGDMVIMMTDGVLDALPPNEHELVMRLIVEGVQKRNPKEVAQYILEQVLACSGEVPSDDMTILVVGIWSLEK